MLTLDYQNLTRIDPAHGLTEEALKQASTLIKPYLETIAAHANGFYTTLDEPWADAIETYTKGVKGQFDTIVVLGIGGSALGPLCIQQALTNLYSNQASQASPRLYVVDNIDPVMVAELDQTLDYGKVLFVVTSKSGTTPETMSQYLYFREQLEKRHLSVREHMVFITDASKGILRDIADRDDIVSFPIPDNVGGRFSVQTPVGLLPAALIGIDIRSIVSGMLSMRAKLLSPDFDTNVPFQLAAIQYLLAQKGKTINVLMPYAQKMIRLADWFRQLLAESIGKKLDREGKIVNVGITPINALGVTDQHSQTQLYNEGPNDKLLLFLQVTHLKPDLPISEGKINIPALDYLNGVSFNHLLQTEKSGTEQAYTQNDRPNLTVTIDEINAYSLGELFMLFEGATAFLGEFFNINAFDQPGVELSKILTRQML